MAYELERSKEREWRSRLRRFGASGLTVAEYCDLEDISVASFYHWRKRLASGPVRGALGCGPFVPVRVTPAPVALVEIHLPNGVRVCLPGGQGEVLRVAIESAGRVNGVNPTEVSPC